jgi:hypothetical protein
MDAPLRRHAGAALTRAEAIPHRINHDERAFTPMNVRSSSARFNVRNENGTSPHVVRYLAHPAE